MENRRRESAAFVALSMFFLVIVAGWMALYAIHGLLLALQDYMPVRGLMNSPFVGARNFTIFFQRPQLPNLIRNGLVLKALELLSTLVLGGVLALIIARLPSKGMRAGITAALMVPVLLPAVFYEKMMFGFTQYPAAFLLRTMVPDACFAAFAGGVCSGMREDRERGALIGVGIAGLLALMNVLTPDYVANLLAQNPLNYAWTDTLGTYAYRTGMLQGSFSIGAAVQLIASCVQAVVAALAAIGFVKLAPEPSTRQVGDHSATWVAALGVVIFALAVGLISGIEGTLSLHTAGILFPLLACVFGGLLTFILSGAPSRKWLAVIAALVLALGNNTISEYLQMHFFGMINTGYPIMMLAPFRPRVFCVLVILALAANRENRAYICVAGALATAALAWGDFTVSLLYTMSADMMNAGMLARNALLVGESAGSGMIYCALPAALLAGCGASAIARRL